MKLYHISLNLDALTEVFSPRLPSAVYEGEDSQTKRICVSNTIEGALTSVPFGGRKLEITQADLSDIYGNYEVLYLKVYEFESEQVQEGNLITPNELWLKGLVPDAEVGGEHWIINQDIKPVREYLIELNGFNESVEDVYSPVVVLEEIPDEDWDEYLLYSPTVIESIEYEEISSLNDLPFEFNPREYHNLLFKMRANDFEGI